MTRSVRSPLRILNGLRKQQRAVQSCDQGARRNDVALQVSDNALNKFNAAGFSVGQICPNGERNADNAVHMGQADRVLEIYYGQGLSGQLNRASAEAHASRAGLNNCRLVGHSESPLLKTRFGRACRAFVNAWRAA